MRKIIENILEETTLQWLEKLGWNTKHDPDIAPEASDSGRDIYSEVILKERLRVSLARINPDVPVVGIEDAVKRFLVTDSPS